MFSICPIVVQTLPLSACSSFTCTSQCYSQEICFLHGALFFVLLHKHWHKWWQTFFFHPATFLASKIASLAHLRLLKWQNVCSGSNLAEIARKTLLFGNKEEAFAAYCSFQALYFFYGVHQSNYQESSKKPLSDESCDFCLLNMSKYKMLHKNSTHSSTPTLINSFSSKTTTNL